MLHDADLQKMKVLWTQARLEIENPWLREDYVGYLDERAREHVPALLEELERLQRIVIEQAVTIATQQHLHQLDEAVVQQRDAALTRAEQAEMRASMLQDSLDGERYTIWQKHFADVDLLAEVQRLSARNQELEIAHRFRK
jgi:hypothetical protein